MSTTFTLSGSYMQVNASLFPAWDYKAKRIMNRSDHRMIDGSFFSYKWSSSDPISFSIEGLSPSNAAQINAWWESGEALIFTVNRDGYDPGLLVKIVNNASPFPRFMPPRTDLYKGKIELESMLPAGLMLFDLADHNGDYIITGNSEHIGVISR